MKINTITATLLLASAAILALAPPSVGQTKSSAEKAKAVSSLTKEDEEAIRKTVMGFEQAWNTHDMKLLASLFREDAEFINVVGMHWRGRDAVMVAHTAFHETTFKNHNIKIDDIHLRSLGGGHVIAVVTFTGDALTTPAGEVIPKRQYRLTCVLVKDSDGWKISHGHNVAVDPEAAQFDPVNKTKK